VVEELGAVFPIDVLEGQKTGWFFDQRDNRRFVASLASGARMLDLYCFTGGFAVQAARGGAACVTGIDSSEAALEKAREAAAQNGVAALCTFRRSEAFAEAQLLGETGERFDLVIADPPAFARSKKDLGPALRGYRKLARLAVSLVAKGGALFIASCSHQVETEAFADSVRRGLQDAQRDGRIIATTGAAPDHPVHPALPESAYLKAQLLALD
jgi:23S rRNA (cytosine1962-C5)-methyltransferase